MTRSIAKAPDRSIRALFLDVDGVLTDGRIYLDGRGRELKVFDTKDGHGMRKADRRGHHAVLDLGPRRRRPRRGARASSACRYCYQGVRDKRAKLDAVSAGAGAARPAETAAIGDDEPDIPMFEAAGFSACPADAAPAARSAATVV